MTPIVLGILGIFEALCMHVFMLLSLEVGVKLCDPRGTSAMKF